VRIIRFVGKFLGVSLALLVIVAAATFAVANRSWVTVNLWPFDPLPVPLGATVLGAFGLGLIAGAALMSLSRLRARWRARRSERRAAALEKAAARKDAEARTPSAGGALAAPRARPALSNE
jgi:uncharacterized integral membrane protein